MAAFAGMPRASIHAIRSSASLSSPPQRWAHPVIPPHLRIDLWDPGIGAQRFYAPGLGQEPVPGVAGGIHDSIVIVEQPVREEAFLEVEPDALYRVQFGRIGWQRNQGDVVRNSEVIRTMPAGLIERHHDVLVLSNGFGETVQKDLHRRRIGIGHHHRKRVVRARLYGGEDIGEGEAPVAKPWRALAALPPDMTDAAFLADARFVLEEQAQALAFTTYTDGSQQHWGSF